MLMLRYTCMSLCVYRCLFVPHMMVTDAHIILVFDPFFACASYAISDLTSKDVWWMLRQ
eukprot:m.353690 g.353690  ORF g.353690 m.353690 type:complete len:59 (-) comp16820_c0_seq1:2186-2362(-)